MLLTGETGSGKEVVAAEIHRASARAAGPYVRINCASIPETLIESELFGHERGAFTGADRRRIGYVEQRARRHAACSTRSASCRSAMQAKLLRVLEERKVMRVGGTDEIDVDVRFVAATNRDLEREVERGTLPPGSVLSPERHDAARAAAARAAARSAAPGRALRRARHAGGEAAAGRASATASSQALARYPWPGNVRELRNVIERAVILADGAELTDRRPARAAGGAGAAGAARAVSRCAIGSTTWSGARSSMRCARRRATARTPRGALGISRRALLYKLKKYRLED